MFPCMISISHSFIPSLYGLQSETLLFIKKWQTNIFIILPCDFPGELSIKHDDMIYLVKIIHDIEDIYDLPAQYTWFWELLGPSLGASTIIHLVR